MKSPKTISSIISNTLSILVTQNQRLADISTLGRALDFNFINKHTLGKAFATNFTEKSYGIMAITTMSNKVSRHYNL